MKNALLPTVLANALDFTDWWSDDNAQPCSNVTWAAQNDSTVDYARGMWVCLEDCDACRTWPNNAPTNEAVD